MALPPEPFVTVLVDAAAVVVGEVTAVIAAGPTPPQRTGKPGERDLGNKKAWQDLEVRVDRVLRGDVVVGSTLTVRKPEGAWVAAVGTTGPFVVGKIEGTEPAPILGRYGPDTWRLDVVESGCGTS